MRDKIHFSNEGVPVVLVSIPLRYMHMPCEVADENDVENCIELIARFLNRISGGIKNTNARGHAKTRRLRPKNRCVRID